MKPLFEGSLVLSKYKIDGFFVVEEGFTFYNNAKDFAIVPKGGLVNGASIPWFAVWLFPRFDKRYNKATALHDLLVGEGGQTKLKVYVDNVFRELTWRESAKWFKAAMKEEGSSGFVRWLFYEAVMLKKRFKFIFKVLKQNE